MKLREVKNELLDRLTPFASTNGFGSSLIKD